MIKKTKVAIFANNEAGLKVVKYLKMHENTEICLLYTCGTNKKLDLKIAKETGLKQKNIFTKRCQYENLLHKKYFKKKHIDFIITVYWPWLIKEDLYSLSKNTINFHPSLLPINRGWYPHVHNIIKKTSGGVSLHQIAKKADQGKIWCQKKVDVLPTDNAKELHARLQRTIINLFKSNWNNIRTSKIIPFEQDHKNANYFCKKDVVKYDKIDINKKILPLDFINILRARSFGKKSFAYYVLDGQKIYVNLSLNRE